MGGRVATVIREYYSLGGVQINGRHEITLHVDYMHASATGHQEAQAAN